jgi:hypothetical protein
MLTKMQRFKTGILQIDVAISTATADRRTAL